MSSSTSPPPTTPDAAASATWPRKHYTSPHSSWPYNPRDFDRQDPGTDAGFYATPRFVTHIDEHAISVLREYYEGTLPRRGKILDLCSSWISHFPPSLETLATPSSSQPQPSSASPLTGSAPLEVFGLGMNLPELTANPILSHRILRDLNSDPSLPSYPGLEDLDAVTCVVSVDYLIHPVDTLRSCKEKMKPGGIIHLIISNRCFPTKAIRRWLEVGEEERLEMVGDYLHFAGFEDIEIITLSEGGGGYWNRVDPLWVVRAVKPATQ